MSPSERSEFAGVSESWGRFGDRAFEWAVAPFDRTSEERAVERFLGSGREVWEHLRARAELHGLPIRGPRAFDFGCGPGRFAQALSQTFDQVVGVDVAPGMVELAQRLDRRAGRCEFVLASSPDLSEFGYGRYTLVFSAYVFQHLPARLVRRYLGELLRLLAPGGGLVLQEHVAVDLPLVSYLPPGWLVRLRSWRSGGARDAPGPRWDDYWISTRRFGRWVAEAGASKVASEPDPARDGRMVSAWFYGTK